MRIVCMPTYVLPQETGIRVEVSEVTLRDGRCWSPKTVRGLKIVTRCGSNKESESREPGVYEIGRSKTQANNGEGHR